MKQDPAAAAADSIAKERSRWSIGTGNIEEGKRIAGQAGVNFEAVRAAKKRRGQAMRNLRAQQMANAGLRAGAAVARVRDVMAGIPLSETEANIRARAKAVKERREWKRKKK